MGLTGWVGDWMMYPPPPLRKKMVIMIIIMIVLVILTINDKWVKNLVGTQAVPCPATRGGPVAAWGLTRRAPCMVIMVIMIYHGDHHNDHETTWWSAHPASHYIRKRAGWVRAERLKLINSVMVNMMIMIDIMTLTLLIWRGQYLYNWTGAETKSGTIAVSRFRRKSLVLIVIIVMIIIIIMNMGGWEFE